MLNKIGDFKQGEFSKQSFKQSKELLENFRPKIISIYNKEFDFDNFFDSTDFNLYQLNFITEVIGHELLKNNFPSEKIEKVYFTILEMLKNAYDSLVSKKIILKNNNINFEKKEEFKIKISIKLVKSKYTGRKLIIKIRDTGAGIYAENTNAKIDNKYYLGGNGRGRKKSIGKEKIYYSNKTKIIGALVIREIRY